MSSHVLWHFRQLCRLAAHLERRRSEGGTPQVVLEDALDAAALEAFVMHARALIDFVWADRNVRREGLPRARADDGLAADYFAPVEWEPDALPRLLAEVRGRVGWGVAHVTYKRLAPDVVVGWPHTQIVAMLTFWLLRFALAADPQRVLGRFRERLVEEVMEHTPDLPMVLDDGSGLGSFPSVGTRGHAAVKPREDEPRAR